MSDPLGLISSATGGAARAAGAVSSRSPSAEPGPSFKDVLMKNIEQVNRLQQDAEGAIEDLINGRRDDLDRVLIAKQKADLAFQTLLQVRNKLVDAYQEIKQMQV